MPSQTLLDDFRYLQLNHNEYARNRDRWRFLYESYVGGKEYRDAGHLTRYALESDGDYRQRLLVTPLDNHCASVVQTYISFLFREKPEREFYAWSGLPDVEAFLRDCDFDGRSFDNFMKDAATWASVFGHCFVMMTKPNVGAQTMAQEISAGVRPYVNLLTPLVVSDWKYLRKPNGSYELVYFKYIEEIVDKVTVIKEWTPTEIKTWEYYEERQEAIMTASEPNELGVIPVVIVYNRRSVVKGIGVSDINDVADAQKMIYNLTSENEQSIRMDGHPSLVIPPTAQLGSGAGALIMLQEGSDPGLNPYYLDHSSSGVASIHSSIEKLVEAIDRMSFTGGVRGTQKLELSGIAMEVEFNLLAAKLSEKATNLELAEEQIWRLFGMYQGREWGGEIEYSREFSVHDKNKEFQQLQIAKSAATSPEALQIIDFRIREMLEDPTLTEVKEIEMEDDPETIEEKTLMAIPEERLTEPHIMRNPETGEEIEVLTEEQHTALAQAGWIHLGAG